MRIENRRGLGPSRQTSTHRSRGENGPQERFQRRWTDGPSANDVKLQQFARKQGSYDYKAERTTQIGNENFKSFPNRAGYDEMFLGQSLALPQLTPAQRASAVERLDEPGNIELDYTHFTIVMDEDRRQARFTAVNIDGSQYQAVKRKKGWVFDSRIPRDKQLGNEAYGDNAIDRGHMVRRRAPMWGPEAKLASSDTFTYTNAGLQHAKLNQEEWLDLENRILDKARNEGKKMTVFTGPVFHESDPVFDNRGKMDSSTQMPQEFWKLVVWNEPGKGLQSEAFVMSQKDDIKGRSGAVEDLKSEQDFQMYRVPLSELEAKTELKFGPLNNECKSCSRVDSRRPLSTQIPGLF